MGIRQGRDGRGHARPTSVSRSPTASRSGPAPRSRRSASRTGRATGVVTTDGEEFHATIVLSNADPQRTYLKLVERGAAAGRFRGRHRGDPDHLAGDEDQPRARRAAPVHARPATTSLRAHTGGVFIGPSIDYMQRAYEDARAGRPGRLPVLRVHTQSALDPTVAPPGKATLSIFTQYFPYELAEGTWDERREEIADHAHAPLRRVRARMSTRRSHRPAGAGPARHRGALRPDRRPHLPGRAGPRASLRHAAGARLARSTKDRSAASILCGSGAWPGGCVMGAPGHNAAHEAIDKLMTGRYR